MRLVLWVVVALLLGASASSPCYAQARKPAVANDGCVDVATLRAGKSLRGLVISGEGTGNSPWLMAIERSVLSKDNPSLYQRAAKAEARLALQAATELKTRLEQELGLPEVEGPYRAFLEREQERVIALLPEIQGKDELQNRFVWVELTNKECINMRRASADAQRVAVWAWSENLADVTRRDRSDLERELRDNNIDVKLKVPDLSRELSVRPETETTWQSRLAIARYTLVGSIDFQGSSGVFMRAGGGKGIGVAEIGPLIQKMMSGSLDELLVELDPSSKPTSRSTNNSQWYLSVTSQVDSLNRREFRITRLDQDPTGQIAIVETALIAKLPQRGWQMVWTSKHSQSANDVTPQALEKVSNDPQIKTAIGLLSALGAGADAEVKKALRYGAATMAAQAAAETAFLRFRDRFTDRLDGPPMN